MEYPITHDDFVKRTLKVRTVGLKNPMTLLLMDEKLKAKRGVYRVEDDHGVERRIRLQTFIDPVPKVMIDKEKILLDRSLKWFEILWMALPVLLIFGGGALGALFGLAGASGSAHIFRSRMKGSRKFLFSGLASIAAVALFLIIAPMLRDYILNF